MRSATGVHPIRILEDRREINCDGTGYVFLGPSITLFVAPILLDFSSLLCTLEAFSSSGSLEARRFPFRFDLSSSREFVLTIDFVRESM